MRIFFALLLAVLPGCAASPPAQQVQIVWTRVENPRQHCEEAAGRRELWNVRGCAIWSVNGNVRQCQIIAPEPRNERDAERFATLGHELLHCFDGSWHDRWGRMNSPTYAGRSKEGSAAAGGTAQD